jgi:hypothetical protein
MRIIHVGHLIEQNLTADLPRALLKESGDTMRFNEAEQAQLKVMSLLEASWPLRSFKSERFPRLLGS